MCHCFLYKSCIKGLVQGKTYSTGSYSKFAPNISVSRRIYLQSILGQMYYNVYIIYIYILQWSSMCKSTWCAKWIGNLWKANINTYWTLQSTYHPYYNAPPKFHLQYALQPHLIPIQRRTTAIMVYRPFFPVRFAIFKSFGVTMGNLKTKSRKWPRRNRSWLFVCPRAPVAEFWLRLQNGAEIANRASYGLWWTNIYIIYMHTYMHIYAHNCVCINMYIYIYIYIRIHTYITSSG